MCSHTSIDVVISSILNRWWIEIINKGWSVIIHVHRLWGICVTWLFFFITLSAWALWTSWVYDSTTRIGLVIERLLRIELLVSIAHSLFILLVSIPSSEWCSILTKAWRPIACWSFVKCYRSKCLFAPSGCIWNHRPSTTVSIVSPTNSWITRPNTEITSIRVTWISTLALTFSCTDVIFAIRPSLHTTSPAIGCRCWLLCNFLISIFWGCSCHLLTPTRGCTLRYLRRISICITVVGCSLCIFLYLFFVQILYLGGWIWTINYTFPKSSSFFIATSYSFRFCLCCPILILVMWVLLFHLLLYAAISWLLRARL